MEGEGVAHGVQDVHTIQVKAVDWGSDRDGAGADDQLVVAELTFAAARVRDGDPLGAGVDRPGGVVKQQLDAGLFRVGGGAVGQVVPVRDVAGQIAGQPADHLIDYAPGNQAR